MATKLLICDQSESSYAISVKYILNFKDLALKRMLNLSIFYIDYMLKQYFGFTGLNKIHQFQPLTFLTSLLEYNCFTIVLVSAL